MSDILDPAHQGDTNDGGSTTVVSGLPRADAEPPKDDPARPLKVTEDGNQIEYNGRKYLTQEAVAAERAMNKQLRETLAALEPHMEDFGQYLQEKRGGGKRQAEKPQPVLASGLEDEEDYLKDVASSMAFYREDGELDLHRAQAHLSIVRRETRREIAPVARGSQEERARTNRERALGSTFVDGKPIADPKYMGQALDSLGAEQLADENVANIAKVVAAGLEYLDLRRNGGLARGARRGEPNFREGSRGRFDGDAEGELSAMDLAAARARGKTPEQWAKMQKQVGGRDNRNDVLEQL